MLTQTYMRGFVVHKQRVLRVNKVIKIDSRRRRSNLCWVCCERNTQTKTRKVTVKKTQHTRRKERLQLFVVVVVALGLPLCTHINTHIHVKSHKVTQQHTVPTQHEEAIGWFELLQVGQKGDSSDFKWVRRVIRVISSGLEGWFEWFQVYLGVLLE